MKRILLPILFIFAAICFVFIKPFTHLYAYDQGSCASDSICYTGSDGADVAPGYSCGDAGADGYVYGEDANNKGDVVSCFQGFCCDKGTPKPPLPPHKGYDLGAQDGDNAFNSCAPTSICYTGDTQGDNNLYPGHKCGTLDGWHYGTAGSTVPKCGLGGAYCCDAGSSATVTPVPTAPPAPCNMNGQNNCVSVNTGLGSIPTNITSVISTAFGILLSFTGGILLIIIVFSGYRIMTSQGDAEKIKGARETLTSAIVGFLFIVFSITILRVIGVDILHIPGLTK